MIRDMFQSKMKQMMIQDTFQTHPSLIQMMMIQEMFNDTDEDDTRYTSNRYRWRWFEKCSMIQMMMIQDMFQGKMIQMKTIQDTPHIPHTPLMVSSSYQILLKSKLTKNLLGFMILNNWSEIHLNNFCSSNLGKQQCISILLLLFIVNFLQRLIIWILVAYLYS